MTVRRVSSSYSRYRIVVSLIIRVYRARTDIIILVSNIHKVVVLFLSVNTEYGASRVAGIWTADKLKFFNFVRNNEYGGEGDYEMYHCER